MVPGNGVGGGGVVVRGAGPDDVVGDPLVEVAEYLHEGPRDERGVGGGEGPVQRHHVVGIRHRSFLHVAAAAAAAGGVAPGARARQADETRRRRGSPQDDGGGEGAGSEGGGEGAAVGAGRGGRF